jgi:hypothetical protein
VPADVAGRARIREVKLACLFTSNMLRYLVLSGKNVSFASRL